MAPRLRIFLSSPGDVTQERLRAHLIIKKLARDYQRYFAIEPFLWEYEPLLASKHFQDAVDPPSSFEVVILFVWSRLGTPLPEKTALREYRGIDGRAPVTGTEWEFEDALQANRARGGKGPPELLVYRRMGGVTASLDNAERRDEAIRQYEALEAFWRRWFKSGDQLLAGYTEYTEYHKFEEFDRRLEADLKKLIERHIKERCLGEASPIWLKGSPFRGLEAYDFDDEPVFFGREAEKREGLTRLQEFAVRGTAFLMVSGSSGSGKSSLARAGLLPGLVSTRAVAEVGLWRRVVMRPGDAGGDPVLALARALLAGDRTKGEGLPELVGKQMTAEELATHLGAGGDPAFLFTKTLRDLADAERARRALLPHEQARLVLLVDQLEEIFTRPEIGTDQRNRFASAVAALAGSGVVWVIATLRSDLSHRLYEVEELRDLAERGARLTLTAPDAAQLLEIIRQPAQAAGLEFDTDPVSGLPLDAMLAKEASAQPGVLPLLSVMLDDLYDCDVARGSTGGLLTAASYRAFGGLREAIGQRAESRLESLRKTDPAAADALPRVLRALVAAGAMGEAPSARPSPLATFTESSPERRLVEAMFAADARLLTVEDRGKGPEVRLAHEALVENWPRAKTIVEESANFIRVRDDIEAQRRKWEAAKRPTELLLARGLPLAEAKNLVNKYGDELSPEVLGFVEASRKHARGRMQLVAAAVGLLLMIPVAGLWWWDANLRIKTAYCANFSERWGVPACVGPLDASTQAARWSNYRFLIQGGRVLELTRVNGAGTPVDRDDLSFEGEPWTEGVTRWHFSYRNDATGTEPSLASVTMESPTGVRLREVSYEFTEDRRQAIARFNRSFGVVESQAAQGSALEPSALGADNVQKRSAIGQHLLSFDAAGHLVRRDFEQLGGGLPMADALGSYGRAYEYGDAGLPLRIHNLDSHGHTLVEKSGIAGQIRNYDWRGDLVTVAWLDSDGRLRNNPQNFARVVWTYSSVGNITSEAYFSEAGAPVERADRGFASLSEEHDEHGNTIRVAFFGTDELPTLSKDEGAAQVKLQYDERGDQVELAYFGADGMPILSKDTGVARMSLQYDEHGNRVEEAYFGVDGMPILRKDTGIARMTLQYDKTTGNEVEQSYFGADGKRILSKDMGLARATLHYDERGNKVEIAYFGADGMPILSKDSDFARMTLQYDKLGNDVEEAYFGADGKPILREDIGVARRVFRFDEHGNLVEEAYFGTDGKPILDKWGFARMTLKYKRGNEVEEAYFDADGKPILRKDTGFARWVRRYDERGNTAEEAYFGADGNPVLGKQGFARITYRYDERGNVVDEAFFGVEGKPILGEQGFARMTLQYDEHGNRVDEAYFGADGKIVLNDYGIARMTFRYDERGNQVEWAYFGLDGAPVGNDRGVARQSAEYDAQNRIVKQSFEDAHGQLMLIDRIGTQVHYSYNWSNEVNGVTYLDEQGRIIPLEVEILEVAPRGVAEGLGLASGDRLLAYDGEAITSREQTNSMVTHAEPGLHKLAVRHGETITTHEVPAGELGVTLANVRAETLPQAAPLLPAH